LVLAADTNCSAVMPDVTGTNFILATDLSGALTISQVPTNAAILPLGTNVVVITVADSSGNAAFSTNTVIGAGSNTPGNFEPAAMPDQPYRLNHDVQRLRYRLYAVGVPVVFQQRRACRATNSALMLSNLTLAAAGNYFAAVAAAGGSSTTSVAALTVNLLSTTVTLASSGNPSGYKDNLNFTAAVTPATATGTIQFYTNGVAFVLETLIAGQAASTNISSLPRGTNVVTAIYSGDASYLSAGNTLAQSVTNHPPAAISAFYTNVLGSPLIIVIASLATNWSDVDGDTVSLAAISVSTNGITLTNTGATLVYFNSNNVADQFTGTITDGGAAPISRPFSSRPCCRLTPRRSSPVSWRAMAT